jgi:hypothetical protein
LQEVGLVEKQEPATILRLAVQVQAGIWLGLFP